MSLLDLAKKARPSGGRLNSLYSLNSHSPKDAGDVSGPEGYASPPGESGLGDIEQRDVGGELSELSELSRQPLPYPPGSPDGIPAGPVGITLDEAGWPAATCASCAHHSFYQPPHDRWRCKACEPPALPASASEMPGWQFCTLPADTQLCAPLMPHPPGWAGWPGQVSLDPAAEVPNLAEAPLGKCRACQFTAPLNTARLCGRCACQRR